VNHFLYVLAGFIDGRQPSVTIHGMLPGIVGGQREREIPPEPVEQLAQVLRSPADIIFRIVEVAHFQTHGGLGHQLHQADRAGS